jgi:hypothetical protein
MRMAVFHSAMPLTLPLKSRIGLGLLLALLAGTLTSLPLSACVQKNKAGGTWITIDGQNVTIKVRGFRTYSPGTGSSSCGCGLQRVSSLASVESAQAMRADNGVVIPEFRFQQDTSVSNRFSRRDEAPWQGFSADVSGAPRNTDVDLVFHGTLAPGATFGALKTQLEGAGNAVGFGKTSNLKSCPTGKVDPLPPAESAPVIAVREMGMAGSRFVELIAVDAEEGLATLRTVESTGAEDSLPAFSPGTVSPVKVRFTMPEGQASASLGVEACNVKGACATWRGDAVDLKVGPEGSASRSVEGVPSSRRQIRLQNGNPGAAMFVLTANGRRFSLRPLTASQWLSLNVSLAVDQPENDLTLGAVGVPGSEIMVLMMEASPED